jgi:hypothetical protein
MHHDQILTALDAAAARRAERRRFLKLAGGTAAGAGALTLLSACGGGDDDGSSATPTPSPTPSSTASPSPTPTPSPAFAEVDILNFALQLEYLEATFYSYAAFGTDLPAAQVTGTGTQGSVVGGRAVTFSDPVVQGYAREIAGDEIAHVAYLRRALGASAVARRDINIDGTNATTGAFALAAQAAGVVASGATFDPYASDDNFLLAAFLFEDVGVTAYRGAITSIQTKATLEAAAGIHAAEAYHAGLIRTALTVRGTTTASLLTATTNISNARDQLDGGTDLDQPIVGTDTVSNVIPADPNGLIFVRSPAQVLNILFLAPPADPVTGRTAATKGGFFPNGVNGTDTDLTTAS